jgi:ComF family protein
MAAHTTTSGFGGVARAARLGGALLDLALPASCAGCAVEGTVLCPRCRRALDVRLALPPGVPLGLPAAMLMPLAQLEWCAPFSGVIRVALHRLKYSGERRLAAPLADAMAARWEAAGVGGEMLVPVPVHAERARRRGYDQAFLLASAVSDRLHIPWQASLERTRHTTPQFELGRRARRANVSGAFEIRPGAGPAVKGRWPILVDDVVTTGSTLVACAQTLYDAGAIAVSALTVARER